MTVAGRRWIAVGLTAMSAVGALPARAKDVPAVAGEYLCVKDCRPSDAPPAIEIRGGVALCRSELGGIFTGRLLSDRSVACFGQTGVLSADGTALVWSNGAVWRRR